MTRRFTKSDGIVERRIRDEHILVPIMSSLETIDSIYTLNETASVIWRDAVAGLPENEIAASLTREFDLDAATAEHDTRRTLDELGALKTLTVAGS